MTLCHKTVDLAKKIRHNKIAPDFSIYIIRILFYDRLESSITPEF